MNNIRVDNEVIINLDNVEAIYHIGTKYTFHYASGWNYKVHEEALPILTKRYLEMLYISKGGIQ